MLALALRGRSSYLTPVKCLKGLPNKREADFMDGEGCFKNLLWAMGGTCESRNAERGTERGTEVKFGLRAFSIIHWTGLTQKSVRCLFSVGQKLSILIYSLNLLA